MTYKTCFEKISRFNSLIGNKKGNGAYLDQQFNMIREEFEELEKALATYQNLLAQEPDGLTNPEDWKIWNEEVISAFKEIRDGCADVVVTTGGLAHRLDIPIDADLESVYKSNMSKFVLVATEAEVWPFIMEVTERVGIDCTASETEPGVWAITSSRDQLGKDNKAYPKGKLLKPMTYKEPDFTPF